MGTSYQTIYKIFLNKITDYDLPAMSDDELLVYCESLFNSAIVNVKKMKHDLNDRDDVARAFNNHLLSVECEVLACQMVVEWIDRKSHTTQLIHMFVGTKDESMASQANHMKALNELRSKQQATISNLMRDYKYRLWVEEA